MITPMIEYDARAIATPVLFTFLILHLDKYIRKAAYIAETAIATIPFGSILMEYLNRNNMLTAAKIASPNVCCGEDDLWSVIRLFIRYRCIG